ALGQNLIFGTGVVEAEWTGKYAGWYDLHLSDATHGKELRRFKGHTSQVQQVAISGDAHFAASMDEEMLLVWDLQTGRKLAEYDASGLSAFAFSPDAQHLVSGHDDGTVRAWEIPALR
ncbi:MAG: WD40 repeat domain-containing protein, partial [Pirellulales bacterium]